MAKKDLNLERIMQNMHFDEASSLYFTDQLSHVKAKIYKKDYPELLGRTLVPVDSTTPVGAARVTYYQNDELGSAKVISDAADDLPRVENTSEEFSHPIRRLGASFGYSKDEILQASFAGRDLSSLKAATCRNIIEKAIDDNIATGNSLYGWEGFINHSAVSAASAPNGNWLTTATGDQMVADLTEMVTAVLTATNYIEVPDTIALPPAHYNKIAHTRMPNIETTVLQFFLSVSPHITSIKSWHKLDTAGAASKPRAICYKNSSDKLWAEVVSEFEVEPAQQRNFETVFNCTALYGGVIIPKPKSLIYRDNLGDA